MSVIKDLLFAVMGANSEKAQGDFDGEHYESSQKENAAKPTGSGGSDWNAAEGEPGHVLNRPFHEVVEYEVIAEEQTVTAGDLTGCSLRVAPDGADLLENELVVGETYIVTLDGIPYEGVVQCHPNENSGTRYLFCASDVWDEYPCSITGGDRRLRALFWCSGPRQDHTVSIVHVKRDVTRIAERYIPDTIARKADDFENVKSFYELPAINLAWSGTFGNPVVSFVDSTGETKNIYPIASGWFPRESFWNLKKITTVDESGKSSTWTANSFRSKCGVSIIKATNLMCLYLFDGKTEYFGTIPAAGIYFSVTDGVQGFTANFAGETKTLDEKFMPNLTSPGGKRYRITVDDTGALSATEVTE